MKRTRMRAVSDRRRKRDAGYPAAREAVWERNTGFCEHCQTRPMSDVHHIAGRGGPDPHRLDNLAGLCRNCHEWVHRNPSEAFRVGLMRSRHSVVDKG